MKALRYIGGDMEKLFKESSTPESFVDGLKGLSDESFYNFPDIRRLAFRAVKRYVGSLRKLTKKDGLSMPNPKVVEGIKNCLAVFDGVYGEHLLRFVPEDQREAWSELYSDSAALPNNIKSYIAQHGRDNLETTLRTLDEESVDYVKKIRQATKEMEDDIATGFYDSLKDIITNGQSNVVLTHGLIGLYLEKNPA